MQYEKLPPAAMPPAQDTSKLAIAGANAGLAPPVAPVVLWSLLAFMVAVGAFASIRIARSWQ